MKEVYVVSFKKMERTILLTPVCSRMLKTHRTMLTSGTNGRGPKTGRKICGFILI